MALPRLHLLISYLLADWQMSYLFSLQAELTQSFSFALLESVQSHTLFILMTD